MAKQLTAAMYVHVYVCTSPVSPMSLIHTTHRCLLWLGIERIEKLFQHMVTPRTTLQCGSAQPCVKLERLLVMRGEFFR